ncbi:MAG: hypothetical protein ACKVOJ_10850 [Sphingomonadaceae bacterium]
MNLEQIAKLTVDCGLQTHRVLGLGFLGNFGGETFKEGLRRIVNGNLPVDEV